MPVHELDVSGLKLPSNVFLAPMAGYTNYPFRKMCLSLGAGLSFTEMVSAKGLSYQNEKTESLLFSDGSPLHAAQIFGSDPALMRAACESEQLSKFSLIDLNMGCPMPKILKNGDGSALLENPPLAQKIVSECVKSGKRISVKYRVGIKQGDRLAADFAKRFEDAGACMIAVHGRTREQIYSGQADLVQIAQAKAAVKIPVVANGGIFSFSDMERTFEETGADAVMIARAALFRPQIFSDLTGREAPPLFPLFLKQAEETKKLCGERFSCVFMRKMAAFYVKGQRNAATAKREFLSARTTEEVLALAEQYFG